MTKTIQLGTRFATWLDLCDGEPCVVKSMDVASPGREVSPCWRELLGRKLATRLGLAFPVTRLAHDSRYGRVSLQRYIAGAKPVTRRDFHRIALTPRGLRILVLDLVARNRDRRPANLLRSNDVVFPIDFNVAFDFTSGDALYEETARMISRWFGLEGIARLPVSTWSALECEARRAELLLSDSFLEYAIASIDSTFLETTARPGLLANIRRRRDALTATLSQWWDHTIVPLNRLLNGEAS